MPYLTWVMGKFLNLGFSLEQVIAMATVSSAKTIGKMPKLATLEVGAWRTCRCCRQCKARSSSSIRATTSTRQGADQPAAASRAWRSDARIRRPSQPLGLKAES
jgi:predicted amidohydrolase